MSLQLCSLNELKNYLRFPLAETSQDALLLQQIYEASSECETVCDRSFTYASLVDDIYDGHGGENLVLDNWPVDPSANFIFQYLSAWDQIMTYDAGDYIVQYDRGIIKLLGGLRFPKRRGGVQATYSYGYQPSGPDPTSADYKIVTTDDLARKVKEYAGVLYKGQQGAIEQKELEAAKELIEKSWKKRYARLFGA